MNKIFSLKRFGRYFTFDLKNAVNNFGLSLLIMCCLPVMLLIGRVLLSIIFGGGESIPSLPERISLFSIALLIMMITSPVKLYGGLTEKKYGSSWLLIPASRLEKFISMLLICLIVVPVAYLIVYLGVDGILSLLIKDYSPAIIGSDAMKTFMSFHIPEDIPFEMVGGSSLYFFGSMAATILIFLLGGLCFKKGKVGKTILALFIIMMVVGIITFIIFVKSPEHFESLIERADVMDPERIASSISTWSWILNILFFGGLGTAIYFRLKTLKH